MGGSPSKMPPIRQRDDLPDSGSINGFSPGDAQGCKQCVLTVAKGISASGARLYREQGTISMKECEQFKLDSKKVSEKQMAFNQFKANLLAGKYFNEQDNGFCSQLMFKNEDLQSVTDISQVPWSKATVPSIRKLTSGGGYSSITKLFIKPAIPFNITFNGESIQVTTMTLFHPCPIRIENIQYDAVLTLGDAADDSSKTILLVPVAGSLSSGQSGAFFSKIASFIPGVLMPNPASGQYEPIDIPTGKDWDLSKIFPGTAQGNSTIVDASYYVWNSTPPMELYLKNTVVNSSWLPNIEQYGWRPISNAPLRKFIMLAKPIPINTFDLQTIRMLPTTPSDDAIPPPLMKSLIYKPSQTCDSSTREKFTVEESCDPFAHIQQPPSTITTDLIVSVVIGIVSAFAVVIGIYFAMKYATEPIGIKLKGWGESFGKMMAQASRRKPPTSAPAPAPAPAPESKFEVENPLAKREAEKRVQEKKKQEEEKRKEEEAKKLFDEQQAKKKDLEEKMKDTTLSEAEQRQIRKEYQKITGEYRPTKAEQEAAAGTGLVKKRYIAPEPEDEDEDEEQVRNFIEEEKEKEKKRDEDAKRVVEEEIKRQEAEEKRKTEEAEAKKKEEAEAKRKKEEAEAKKKEEAEAKRKTEEAEAKRKTEEAEAKKKEEDAKKKSAQPPKAPPQMRAKTIGTKNLGLREDTAKVPRSESTPPPIPPRENPIFARKIKEKEQEFKEKQKTQVQLAKEKIENAKTDSQEEMMKKQLASLKEKQAKDKEAFDKRVEAAKTGYLRKYYGLPATATERELQEAQSRLRQSVAMYRRGQQGRDIRTGRSRHKTLRN